MFILKLEYNNNIISERILSRGEIDFIHTKTKFKFDIEFIMESYKHYLNLDISEYRLNEYYPDSTGFVLKIRGKDLENLRDDKLNKLGL